MSRAQGLYQPIYSSQAQYVGQWAGHVGPISQALRAVAPRTADTGQLTLATMNGTGSVPASTTYYEIYAFADALQASKPIYVRIEYVTSANSLYTSMNVAVGTGTNGSGTLTGILYVAQQFNNAAAGSSNVAGLARAVYTASGDGSYLSLLMGVQPTAGPTSPDLLQGFVIERTRDADGTANGNGYVVWRWGGSLAADAGALATSYYLGVQSRIYDAAATQTTATSFDIGAYVPTLNNLNVSAGTYDTTSATAQAYPVFGHAGLMPQGASRALALAYIPDVPRAAPISLTGFGGTAGGTWLPMAGTVQVQPYATAAGYAPAPSFRSSNTNALCPVFRWE